MFDNVVAIELRAIAGVTYALVEKTFVPDAAAGAIFDITDGTALPSTVSYLDTFPYLDHPVSGFDVLPLSTPA